MNPGPNWDRSRKVRIRRVGPATESREKVGRRISAGVDVIRLHMAHAPGDWVSTLVKNVRTVSAEMKRHVAVMMDVKGPEIRTAAVVEPIELNPGETFEF